jgi:glucose-6-phosphate 1-dehydrogenase
MEHLRESQIFRIDHYLGKETVQNILVFRFANGIFEPLWNNRYIDSIQISVCEEIGVGNRGPYFDQNGITRDIIQNHALQMLSLLCIEPPHSLTDPNAIRDEKVKVLRSIKRHTPQEAAAHSVRGQYVAGSVQGETVCGYKEEKGISSTSKTETYSALLLEIDNWRWKGVPIYVRAGKRLPKRITDITIYFKSAPHSLFRGRHVGTLEQNCLTIQVQPKEGMALHINSKPPGLRLSVEPVQMDFQYNQSFGVASSDAYERLLLDAMRGDSTLFTRNDEIEEAWALLEPFFDAWSDKYLCPLHDYESGTWGPVEGDKLLEQRNHKWRQL